MENILISIEATADLPKNYLEKYHLSCCPMDFTIDGETYSTLDNSIDCQTFYQKMRQGAKISTSQINTYNAKKYFEELLKQGKDIIHISFSSALSGTYKNMEQVATELNSIYSNKIYLIDSLNASIGQGLLAIIARENEGKFENVEDFISFIDETKHHLSPLFIVDNLKYLARSGRIGKLSYTLGSVLQIKPLLYVDKNGNLTSYGKVISRKKSITSIAEKISNNLSPDTDKIFIGNADCLEDAKFLQKLVEEKTKIKPEILDLGVVIASHSGPGTLAVFAVNKD